MNESLLKVVVVRKWQLATGYHAVELQSLSSRSLPVFEEGACLDLAQHANDACVRVYPLCASSPPDAYVLGVRSDDGGNGQAASATHTLNNGDEVFVSRPDNPRIVLANCPRTILFAAGVGVVSVGGIAKRLALAGQNFELYNFARTPERAILREELHELRSHGPVHHYFGLTVDRFAQVASHALSPTHAATQIYCSGPPDFMDLIDRHAQQWVYPENIHKIVLGEKRRVSTRGNSLRH